MHFALKEGCISKQKTLLVEAFRAPSVFIKMKKPLEPCGIRGEISILCEYGVLIDNYGNKVDYPGDCACADDPDNTDDNEGHIVFGNTLDNTVNSPDNVKRGNAENDFQNPRKLVEGFD